MGEPYRGYPAKSPDTEDDEEKKESEEISSSKEHHSKSPAINFYFNQPTKINIYTSNGYHIGKRDWKFIIYSLLISTIIVFSLLGTIEFVRYDEWYSIGFGYVQAHKQFI